MIRMTKKNCLTQGGTWRNRKCVFNKSSHRSRTGISPRTPNKESLISDVEGIGSKRTKELATHKIYSCDDVKSIDQLKDVDGIGVTLTERILRFCKIKIRPTRRTEKKEVTLHDLEQQRKQRIDNTTDYFREKVRQIEWSDLDDKTKLEKFNELYDFLESFESLTELEKENISDWSDLDEMLDLYGDIQKYGPDPEQLAAQRKDMIEQKTDYYREKVRQIEWSDLDDDTKLEKFNELYNKLQNEKSLAEPEKENISDWSDLDEMLNLYEDIQKYGPEE